MDTILEDWNEENHMILFKNSSDAIENLITLFTSLYGSFQEYVLDALREHLKRLADGKSYGRGQTIEYILKVADEMIEEGYLKYFEKDGYKYIRSLNKTEQKQNKGCFVKCTHFQLFSTGYNDCSTL